ncbi:MAG: leucine-rich repeat domain-containing protein [Rikenellaceae bacterium]
MKKNLILVLLFAVLTSCTKEVTEPLTGPNTETTTVSLTASLVDAETRVTADTSSDDEWSFTWDTADAISAWYTDCTGVNQFTTKTYDKQSSTFTGDIVTDAESHRFVYPYEEGVKISNGCYPIDITGQDGTLNKTYFINDNLIATGDIIDEEVTSLAMQHLGGFMVVDVYLEGYDSDNTYTLTGVSYSKEGGMPVKAEIDMTKNLESGNLYSVITTEDKLTASVAESFSEVTDGGIKYLQAITRLNILPFDVEVNGSLTVEITVEITNPSKETFSKTLTATLTNTGSESLPFARATHNFTYLTLSTVGSAISITGATINDWDKEINNGELGFAEEFTCTASEIDADNIPVVDTWVITDEGEITEELMAGVRAAIELAGNADRSIKIIMPNATSIGAYAFSFGIYPDVSSLTAIELPKVTKIGESAFYCCGFTTFGFEGITEVGSAAFSNCINLTEVTSFSLTSIPAYAFVSCSFSSFDFEGVTEIGYGAFLQCTNLTEIELPSTITSIGIMAFYNCPISTLTLNWTGDDILTYVKSDEWISNMYLITININIPAGTMDDYKAKGWTESLLAEKKE